MNIQSIILLAIVLFAACLALRYRLRHKGKCDSCCGCPHNNCDQTCKGNQ